MLVQQYGTVNLIMNLLNLLIKSIYQLLLPGIQMIYYGMSMNYMQVGLALLVIEEVILQFKIQIA